MADLIRFRDGIRQWPYSGDMLRADEPRLSLSAELPDHELATLEEVGVYVKRIKPTEAPPVDDSTHRVEVARPIEVDGVWTLQWEVVELTQEEKDAWQQGHVVPRWVQFGVAVSFDPAVNAFLDTLPKGLMLMVGVGLGQAAKEDPATFLGAWSQARVAGLVPAELLTRVVEIATGYDLPSDFIAALSADP